MFRFFSLLTLLIFTTIFISCSNDSSDTDQDKRVVQNPEYGTLQNQENPVRIELIKTLSFDDEDETLISGISFPVIDKQNNIYFIDGRQSKLVAINSDGEVLWVSGQEGSGPGDFERPRGLVLHNNHLYTANISGSRIDKFDLQGNFIETYSLDDEKLSFATIVGFTDNGYAILNSTTWGTLGAKITLIDLENTGKVVSEFIIDQSKDLEIPRGVSSGPSIGMFDSLMVSGNVMKYELTFYDPEAGDTLKSVQRDWDKIVRPGFYDQGASRGISTFGGVDKAIKFSDDHFVVLTNWPTNVDDPDDFAENGDYRSLVYNHSLDFYDVQGILLYSMEGEGLTPEIGKPSFVDNEGHLYTVINGSSPEIRKYSVTFP